MKRWTFSCELLPTFEHQRSRRTPTVEVPMGLPNNLYGNGRDHNHHGFTTWLAGAASCGKTYCLRSVGT